MNPRRSVLYLPGANSRALEKAQTLACDALIFDLEDAVAPTSKSLARRQVERALHNGAYGYREIVLRVNGIDTPWGRDDLALAAKINPHAVLFPKVESAGELRDLVAELDRAGGADLPVWVMIETPKSILNVESIAHASTRISALIVGTSDLTKELRARHTRSRSNLSYALQHVVLAARAARIDVIDGVHLDFRNVADFEISCTAGRDMGFDGKSLIHPSQIETANEIFGTNEYVIEHAEKVLNAWQAAIAEGRGVAELDGQLIENLHAAEAERVLEFAQALKARSKNV
ncbi:MAG: citrate lyase subunit beta/citryl-CoA lyase [Gammaproteobacteria bacterium]|jgi:citrate lyase subunit beta/citryl-CoA lyase